MSRCGYTLAGFESLAVILDLFASGKRERWEDNFTPKDISNFLSNTCSGLLHSFGQDFPNKKKYGKYNENKAAMLQSCRDMGFFDNCNFVLDSGGFQISIGRLSRRESDLLFRMYYEYLEKYSNSFDKAFILDIPPGPGCEIFHDFYDVYKINLESYKIAENLPKNVRDKLIYIHHFRTPKLWEIYTKIMRENELFPLFNYHATGGIVANMASDMSIPCIIYVLPLIPMINEAKKYNKTHLNFHILGGATFRDILFYELFTKVIKDKHNIDVNFTYDSSGPYKQVMTSRYLSAFDNQNNMQRLNIKSDVVHLRFTGEYTAESYCQKLMDDMCDRWGFKKINIDGIYGKYIDRSGNPVTTFHHNVKTYFILYTLELFAIIQDSMKEFANEAYPIYKSGNYEEFNHRCLEVTQKLNQGKITRKQTIKANSISRSLDMLVNLDEDYCKYLVDKFLAKDEFTELDLRSKSLLM